MAGSVGWWVGDHKLLGANWGAQATMFFQDNSVEIADFHASQDFAMGDIFIQPLNLGWHQPRSDFMVTAGVYLPTGKYHPGGDDNSGLGMWTLELGAGSTLYFDEEKQWHASAMGYFEINSEKRGTDSRVGNILTIEGGLGRSWYEGALSAGIAYYAQWKLTSDKIRGLEEIDPELPHELKLEKSRLFGVGPEINFPIMIKDKLLCIVTARYQWEFDARSTLEGENFNLFFNFPISGSQ